MNFKKVIKRAAIIIIVLLLVFKGFLMFRDYKSYKDVIHENADQIVKIDIDGIGQSMLVNAITNSDFYLQNKTEKDTIEEDGQDQGKGFNIPSNMFLYTIKNQPKTSVFSSLKISDSSDFKNFISQNFKIVNFRSQANYVVSSNTSNTLQIAYNNKRCVLAYSDQPIDVNQVFQELLVEGKSLDSNGELWSKIKDADSHISYLTKDNNLDINFKSGQAQLNGNLVLPQFFDVPKTLSGTTFSEDASITFDLNLLSTINYVSFKHNNQDVDTDSLNTYYNGHLALEVAKATYQTDSVVSYEYNDDFEKVETVSAVQKQVPEINVQLSSQGQKLYNYLEKLTIIRQGKLSKRVFPLYQFKIDATDNGLYASTDLNKNYAPKNIKSSNVLDFNIDFEKLQQQNYFPLLNTYFDKLENLTITGVSNPDETIAIEGQIDLKDKNINALAQFIFSLKQ
ncbi:hypothetical protein JAO71_01125 [Olleya sp. YSTF-M6]|uniref:DUF945 domain-containing protein n=1 Tax=Olleya sediminilitoris TaxID=2795739 RepID=A0ABS1WGZ2_9FLAO|nr:hypothetical protein [Olleya sediminilitoris]MBL7558388.1 hypothetical protein [Olleya sediminilitoris]